MKILKSSPSITDRELIFFEDKNINIPFAVYLWLIKKWNELSGGSSDF